MNRVYGRYRGGRVELESPVDWPDGVRVALSPENAADDRDTILKLMDEVEPLELTPADEAEIAAARAAVGDVSRRAVERRLRGKP
jgi:hypothetical protein